MYICNVETKLMNNKFEIIFLQEVIDFFEQVDTKARDKIIFNIHKSQKANDNTLFKKLTDEIWEFRTLYSKKQYRLFAFWDKSDKIKTLVVATHGIVKKTKKTPKKEIEKAEEIKKKYIISKNNKL